MTGKSHIHREIGSLARGGDDALEEIVRLIDHFSIKADKIQDLRKQLPLMELQLDVDGADLRDSTQ